MVDESHNSPNNREEANRKHEPALNSYTDSRLSSRYK